jgi:putative ABC transport system permease protein
MKFTDKIKLSQTNLWRAKLRTFLTVVAVFIGAFTISMTNGVGNGIRSYVDTQLGNVGVENVLQVQAPQSQFNPVATDVVEYDPNKTTGLFNFVMINSNDIERINAITGVTGLVPLYNLSVSYVTAGDKKYEATVTQHVDGLNLDMETGRTVAPNSNNEITIPVRYVEPLGFSSSADAMNKTLTLGYKNSQNQIIEKQFTIVGIQQASLLGNSALSISLNTASEINNEATAGIPGQTGVYQGVLVTFDPNATEEEVDQLKDLFAANGYNASTFEDQIGTVKQVIDAALMVLNIFGGIALLAATFGIVNTLLMAVNERTSEIGLMKALGANSRTIFTIFSLEAASIGFWGALLGIAASIGVGNIINNVASNNFLKDFVGFDLLAFPPVPSLLTLAGIILLAFIAGALPSLKASRLDPIKALRYE